VDIGVLWRKITIAHERLRFAAVATNKDKSDCGTDTILAHAFATDFCPSLRVSEPDCELATAKPMLIVNAYSSCCVFNDFHDS
jgi:hypothetical protein